MINQPRTLSTLSCLLVLSSTSLADTIYVDRDAASGGDGLSWATAYDSLQDGLADALPGDQIWVAEGVYTPDHGAGHALHDRLASFYLREGVELYGGFLGTEGTVEERAGKVRKTVLSGDLKSDDGSVGMSDNSLHVVQAHGVSSSSVLDGFRVRGGNADGTSNAFTGGGLYATLGASPILRGLQFIGNAAVLDGAAAICLGDGAPLFKDCRFAKNAAGQDAGGVYLALSNRAVFEDCRFEQNTAGRYGGAVNLSLSAHPRFQGTKFRKNEAAVLGGAIYSDNCDSDYFECVFSRNTTLGDGGAYYGSGSPRMTACRFRENTAELDGGAMFVFSLASAAELVDCRFARNSAGRDGGGVFNSGEVLLLDCRFTRNEADRDGAGLNVSGTGQDTRIYSSRFRENFAGERGGAIYTSGTGNCTVAETSLTRNTAERGGALYHGESGLAMTDCRVRENFATEKGGGVFLLNALAGANITDTVFRQNSTGVVGGALYVTNNSGPRVEGCLFLGNFSEIHGGAVYNTTSESAGGVNHARYISCEFVANKALFDGGAFFNTTSANGGDCSPLLLDCDFYQNRADKHGGALFNIAFEGKSDPSVYNCSFIQNEAGQNGGGVYNSTTAHPGSKSRPDLLNCVMNGNRAGVLGGAFFNTSSTSDFGNSNAKLTNCTLAFNSAGVNGGGFYNVEFGTGESRPSIGNSILWGNADGGLEDSSAQLHVASGFATVEVSNVQHWTGFDSNMSTDPVFRDALGKDMLPGTYDDDYRLHESSPCIDQGLSALLPGDGFDIDQDGNLAEAAPLDRGSCDRSVNRGRGDGLGPVDLGAHEEQGCKRQKHRRLQRLAERLL